MQYDLPGLAETLKQTSQPSSNGFAFNHIAARLPALMRTESEMEGGVAPLMDIYCKQVSFTGCTSRLADRKQFSRSIVALLSPGVECAR